MRDVRKQIERILADTGVEFKRKVCRAILEQQNGNPTAAQLRLIKAWVRHLDKKETDAVLRKLNINLE